MQTFELTEDELPRLRAGADVGHEEAHVVHVVKALLVKLPGDVS